MSAQSSFVNNSGFSQKQTQIQNQKQIQKMSQIQIQAVNFLSMTNADLREKILKEVSENPALEIIFDPLSSGKKKSPGIKTNLQNQNYSNYTSQSAIQSSDANQSALESRENRGETLQEHLMNQLNLSKITPDEYELSQKLIYNLDKDGCYGSMLAPETFLDKSRPLQTKQMLQKCIQRIQQMDPIGTCCKNLEESLFVQAKILNNAPELALFILDGHLELLSPPQSDKVLEKLKAYKHSWHSKKFAPPIILDKLELSKLLVEQSIEYILKLNPRPAGEYISDSTFADYNKPNIVLNIEKISGSVSEDDFSSGIIRGNNNYYFQVKYSNHDLPELRISPDFSFDKNSIKKAQEFINILSFRQNSIILQGCAIVKNQIDFFLNGPGNLKPLTRKKIASQINVHESTISRITGKKSNKYFQTPWGLFSASYFFTSGINSSVKNQKLSAETVKLKIIQILQDYEQKNHKDSNKKNKQLSDSNLTKILNDQGINISRRTVNKYRSQIGITNSYLRT